MCDEVSSSLATQCLAFCQTMASQAQAFNFSLTLDTSFCFSLDTRVGAPVKQVTRKTSPSTQRRNERRRKLFLESKQTESKSAEETRNLFSCDVCDFTGMSRKDLNIHINRQHKDLEQLDGNISLMNPTYDDSQKPELPTEIAEDVLTLKLDIEYLTKSTPPTGGHWNIAKNIHRYFGIWPDLLHLQNWSPRCVWNHLIFFYLLMWAEGVPEI